MTQRATAIVVSYNTGPALAVCLDGLEAEAGVDAIVLVDNGNPPALLDGLRARAAASAKLTLITGHGNIGFGRGCNLGARAARAAFLAFINPDVRVEPGCVAGLIAAAAAAPQPCVAGARVLWPDGSEQRGARRDLMTPWRAFVAALGLGRLERLSPLFRDPHRERDPAPGGPIAVGAISGAAFVMAAEAFAGLGGFDEAYFLHVEDIDLCRRAHEAGGTVLFVPLARVRHLKSTSEASAWMVEAAKAQSFMRYFWKFARSPGQKAAAWAFGGPVCAALLARAAWRRFTARRQVRGWSAGRMRTSSNSTP